MLLVATKAPLPVGVSLSHLNPAASTSALCPTRTLKKPPQGTDLVPGAGGCSQGPSPKTRFFSFPSFLPTQNREVPEAAGPRFIGCGCAQNPGLGSAGAAPNCGYVWSSFPALVVLTRSWTQYLCAHVLTRATGQSVTLQVDGQGQRAQCAWHFIHNIDPQLLIRTNVIYIIFTIINVLIFSITGVAFYQLLSHSRWGRLTKSVK